MSVFDFPQGGETQFSVDFDFPQGGETRFLLFFDFPQGGETQFSAIFDFPQGGESRFFPISDKKLRFFGSQRLILSKNCDFSAPDAHFCKKRGAVLHLRGVGSVEILIFYSSEASERSFSAISARPRARKDCFRQFLLSRGLGKLVFGVFYSAEASDERFFIARQP